LIKRTTKYSHKMMSLDELFFWISWSAQTSRCVHSAGLSCSRNSSFSCACQKKFD